MKGITFTRFDFVGYLFLLFLLGIFPELSIGANLIETIETNQNLDFQSALSRAKKENKLLLLNFSGSDWSGESRALNQEVLTSEPFKKYAEEYLIQLQCDFPNDTILLPSIRERNQKIREDYQINAIPTLLLLDPLGRPIWRGGYFSGGGEAYVHRLKAVITAKNLMDQERFTLAGLTPQKSKDLSQDYELLKKRHEMVEKTGLYTDLPWLTELGFEFDLLSKEGYFYLRKIKNFIQEGDRGQSEPLISKLREIDSINRKGYLEELEFFLILSKLDKTKKPEKEQLENTLLALSRILKEVPNLSDKSRFNTYMAMGDFSLLLGEVDRGMDYYKKSREFAIEDSTKEEIEKILVNLREHQKLEGSKGGL